MSDTSTNLGLQFLLASQTQKHITLNENLNIIDNLLMLAVNNRVNLAPPISPSDGQRFIIPNSATGEWAGKTNAIATYNNLGWEYCQPKAGFLCFVVDENIFILFDGTNWRDIPLSTNSLQNIPKLGIGTIADANNQLSTKLNNAIFGAKYANESGTGDVRVKLNKEATAKTASFIFQTNWSGKAELGLMGDDEFGLKYSTDGINFNKIYTINQNTFAISPNGSSIQNLKIGPNIFSTAWANGLAAIEVSASLTGDRYAFFDFHAADSQSDYSARIIRSPSANGNFIIENIGSGDIEISSGGNINFSTSSINRSKQTNSSFRPAADNTYSLGEVGARWSSIWAANGTIQTSDARDKIVERRIDKDEAISLISQVKPIFFKWREGSKHVEAIDEEIIPLNPENPNSKSKRIVHTQENIIAGKRIHAGFIAQEFQEAFNLLGMNFGAWGIENSNDSNSKQWIRPDQLIPILWAATSELIKRINALEAS